MSSDAIAQQRDAFIVRYFGFASGTFNMFSIYIGDRLGLYRALSQNGRMTPKELADNTNTHERSIREWLEQQTVAGILEVNDETLDADERRYKLPVGHAEPLIECVHDMSNPVEALGTMHRLARKDGSVLIVDERA